MTNSLLDYLQLAPEKRQQVQRCLINDLNPQAVAHDLLDATNILLVPGSGFDWKDPDHFRIVMLPQADVLSDAIRRMGTFLDGYKQK